MATPVLMPKPGNTVEACALVGWRKKIGETVAQGEIIADIETDKAAFEIESPTTGTLLALFFEPSDLVPVFANIAVIGNVGEDVEEYRKAAGSGQQTERKKEKQEQGELKNPPAPPTRGSDVHLVQEGTPVTEDAGISPRARRHAREHAVNLDGIRGSGPGGRIVEQDVREQHMSGPRVSPLAAQLIQEGKTTPVLGSGVNGLICADDLGEAPKPLSKIRRTIASRMRGSLAETAQYTLNTSADATAMLAIRKKVKEAKAAGKNVPNVSINDMVIFATIKALKKHPEVNGLYSDGKIFGSKAIHIGFACDTPRGLLVPVVRNAHTMTIIELGARIKALSQEASDSGISPDDLTGGTFTVSNLGMFGIESFSPVINAPQVAILGVCSIQPKPVRKGENVFFIDSIGLSLTSDHQVLDGAPAARFLQTIVKMIENIGTVVGL
ncbi:MAG: hypothetical protein A2268_13680 [Candidatus Raymondbacteria bacterium RifOxyA12_full_50_37]|uniref:Dihydrolipoamide acetyltransferase component of pyruvate dehydrogenase complex n=1 Tax=Candidatus Raymondbacteria bacterium RIFOXYD12_FULL_49_13 TaxID=1817890 RepID=A0A1F7F0U2_UNCRA|nr:MAG: hypothetical protein A2248_22855 [Candidatus Raymondbacteria bacterium RIFOXYA2_FULL_49_16]OGJ88406.1 MAG: hypothetical protein A2350_14425 [Candidatus Raymondbacteria bacterium RifOxyB12_full_50_8]OGJ91863.1 MAG: hypothetical protein A2268_13680 [Candidatus Raymondbacteria bacterium RifOxyA12_full_50_37]OGK00106.1 MAG: hypothetical protein A2519_12845 [Candidatus Raymondbacteria bacterium RIFOXYD12_FULL_49_13]OGK06951.1 MAG: hypothetical protein A2487_11150 [Candidatus Raymondbacteria 